MRLLGRCVVAVFTVTLAVSGADIASAAAAKAHAMTKKDLLSAPVPGLRGNPAGRLENGKLPHPAPGGSVELLTDRAEAPPSATSPMTVCVTPSPL